MIWIFVGSLIANAVLLIRCVTLSLELRGVQRETRSLWRTIGRMK